MTTDTKVADLPGKLRARAARLHGQTAGADLVADELEECAKDIEAALSRQSPSYEALDIIARSVASALERAGVTECDDPGEAIDVLREGYEQRIAVLSAQPEQQGAGSAIDAVISSALALIRGSEEFETADGLVNAAQLHLWHALEDAIERVGPAEVISHANLQPVGQERAAMWVEFAENGNIRFWTKDQDRALEEAFLHARQLTAFYTSPPAQVDLEQTIELVARAMAIASDWNGWDTAKTCAGTLNGNEPDEERDYFRHMARIALIYQQAGSAK